MTKHPITPPPELEELLHRRFLDDTLEATWAMAYQAGADQELEACLRYVGDNGLSITCMRTARRPKPPTLKEQALAALEQVEADFNTGSFGDTIRRALEAMPHD